MAKSKNKSGLEKNIYLSDILDEDFFNQLLGAGKYVIFDKEQIIKQISTKNISTDTLNYMTNAEVEKALTKAIRNKKIKAIIYLLYTSKPKVIINNINSKIIPKLNTSIKLKFSIITTYIDSRVYQYKEKDFENIHIRPDDSDK